MEKQVKISIIVPVFNVENYIGRCMDSLLSQDMADFEIIAVDDGSVDKSGLILDQYTAKDSRIKVYHLQNGGVSRARNYGIEKAQGEFIFFVDGDDFIIPECLNELYTYAREKNADVLIFSYRTWQDGVFGQKRIFSRYRNVGSMDAKTAIRNMLLEGDATIWNKLCKRTLFADGGIRFPEEVRNTEDFPASCAMLSKAKHIEYLDKSIYCYVQRPSSVVHRQATLEYVRNYIMAIDLIKKEINSAGLGQLLIYEFYCCYIASLLGWLSASYKLRCFCSFSDLINARLFLESRFSKLPWHAILFNPYLKYSYKIKVIRIKLGIYKLEKKLMSLFSTIYILI